MDEDPVRLEIPLDPGSNFANLMYHICTLKTVLSIIVIWLLFAVTANFCRLARFRGPPATMLEPICSIMNSGSAYTKCLMVDTGRGHEPLPCLNG